MSKKEKDDDSQNDSQDELTRQSKIVHILVKEQNGIKLMLEVQFSIRYVEQNKPLPEEIHLSSKVIFIRPYISVPDLEDRFTFPVEIKNCNLKHAHQVMVLCSNATRIEDIDLNFLVNIDYALLHHNLAEISRWLGKEHTVQEIKEMLKLKLENPFFSAIRLSNNNKPYISRMFNRSRPLREQLQKYLQTIETQ